MALKATITIAVDDDLSAAVELKGARIVGFVGPAGWDAAHISFQVSQDNATYQDLYDVAGNALSVHMDAAYAIGLSTDLLAYLGAWNWVKIQSGVPGALVSQTANREITLVTGGRLV